MAAFLSSVLVAESHKTLQAIINDILFPCEDYATSDAQEKPCTDLLCQKKQNKNKKQWEHYGSKSKIEVTVRSCCEKQFEKKKKTLREALKFFDCRISAPRQIQPSYKKSHNLITCLHSMISFKTCYVYSTIATLSMLNNFPFT